LLEIKSRREISFLPQSHDRVYSRGASSGPETSLKTGYEQNQ